MLRRHTVQALALSAAPVGALAVVGALSWAPTPGGSALVAALTSLAGAAGIAAVVFALDAMRIRRAFAHLRAGKGALGYEPHQRQQVRERRQHEGVAQLRRQVEQLSAIRDLALIANDDVRFERILERALTVLGGLLAASEITIYLVEGEGELVPVARRLGERITVRGTREIKAVPREAAQALEARRTVVDAPKNAGARAATLLVADGRIMGVLELRLARGGLTCEPVELARQLEGLAKHIALAICKPTLYDRAVVDALTGLYTKRHFLEQVQHYMAQRARLGTPLSMIILDVDHFKQVNDVHGHVAGDRVLVEVARRVRKGVRAYDLAFRYGGEEVVVLLPNTPLPDAVGLAERLRLSLGRKPMDTGEQEIKVTASFGVAEYDPAVAEDAAALVGLADQALYQAKHGGRNQVVSTADVIAAEATSEAQPAPAETESEPRPSGSDQAKTPSGAEPRTVGEAFRARSSAA